MADPVDITAARVDAVGLGPAGSVLGKYYTTLSLYEYHRENPFFDGSGANDLVTSEIINLPLPIQLYDRTSSSFSQQNMGVIGDLVNLDAVGGLAAAPLRMLETLGPGAMGALTNVLSQRLGGFGTLAGNLTRVVGNNVDVSAISTAVQQLIGVTPNPNPVVKFNGPTLRNFNYTWYLAPKNTKESQNIKRIIEMLKGAGLPSRSLGSNALLGIPKLAQMNFYPWDNGGAADKWGWTSESLIKMKRCHISNVSANYNPANVPSFFYDNRPVIIELSIELQEVEYMFQEEWTDFGVPSEEADNELTSILGSIL